MSGARLSSLLEPKLTKVCNCSRRFGAGAAAGAAGRAAAGAAAGAAVHAAAGDPCGDFTVGLFNTPMRTHKAKAIREKRAGGRLQPFELAFFRDMHRLVCICGWVRYQTAAALHLRRLQSVYSSSPLSTQLDLALTVGIVPL